MIELKFHLGFSSQHNKYILLDVFLKKTSVTSSVAQCASSAVEVTSVTRVTSSSSFVVSSRWFCLRIASDIVNND